MRDNFKEAEKLLPLLDAISAKMSDLGFNVSTMTLRDDIKEELDLLSNGEDSLTEHEANSIK